MGATATGARCRARPQADHLPRLLTFQAGRLICQKKIWSVDLRALHCILDGVVAPEGNRRDDCAPGDHRVACIASHERMRWLRGPALLQDALALRTPAARASRSLVSGRHPKLFTEAEPLHCETTGSNPV